MDVAVQRFLTWWLELATHISLTCVRETWTCRRENCPPRCVAMSLYLPCQATVIPSALAFPVVSTSTSRH